MNNIAWVFHGEGSKFASGVFSNLELAEKWIAVHELSGLLTQYPVDHGAYDYAVSNSYFDPKREDQKTAEFVQMFSNAGLEHYHYENGIRE